MMAFIGVRSSWLMLARNWLLVRLALSAARRAASSCWVFVFRARGAASAASRAFCFVLFRQQPLTQFLRLPFAADHQPARDKCPHHQSKDAESTRRHESRVAIP